MDTVINNSDSEHITISQAALRSGLSESTLSRFAEAEYFKCIKDNQGNFLVDYFDLCKVLNLKPIVKKTPKPEHKTAINENVTVNSEPKEKTIEVKLSPEPEQEPREDTPVSVEAEQEISKLKAICSLQEKLIEFKEQQVASLVSERDWLRSRVEKLEEKSDRDQLILVSMSETQRNMVTHIQSKKSGFQAALEWLGLSNDSSGTGTNTPKTN
jgi:hypothetical protein